MSNFFVEEKKILKNIKATFNICSNPNIKIQKKISKILKYEKKHKVYKLDNNYFSWDYFRPYLNRIIEDYESPNYKYEYNLKKLLNLVKYKNLLYLPFFVPKKKVDYIFFGHPRGQIKKKKIIDEYIDHLIKNIPRSKRKLVFGYPHITHGTKYNHLEKRFFIHWIYLIIKLSTFFKYYFFRIDNIYPKELKNISQNIFLKINIENWWLNYLKKTQPKTIFVVDINSNIPIVRAANKLGITICEIQHGSPDKKKLIYNFCSKKRLGIPTYYIGWGKYWEKKMKNYYKKKYFVMGKNISNKIPICNRKNKGILIIDQYIGRKTLINKAIQLKKKDSNLNILYRFHPSKTEISDEIKILKENNIEISNPFKKELKDDLKNIRYIIAHSSTLIYELANQKYDVCTLESINNQDGLMSDIKQLSSSKKIFNLIYLDFKKIKNIKIFEQINYNFLSWLM